MIKLKHLITEDKVSGGLADKHDVQSIADKHNSDVELIQSELEMGIEVEKEHTTDEEIAKEIALDHLYEDPRYYTHLKKIHIDEQNLVSVKVGDMLNQFTDKYKGKTIILLDTETLGLHTNIDYIQLTELAAMAIDGDSFETLDKMNFKANLRPDSKRVTTSPYSAEFKDYVKREKGSLKRKKKRYSKKPVNWKDMKINKDKFFTPKMAMDLTRYDEPTAEFIEEKELIEKFIQFVGKFDNVVLMAQNARFDMKVVVSRARKYNLRFPANVKVADTLTLTKNVLTPLLQYLKNSEDVAAKEFRQRFVKTDKRGTERLTMSLGIIAKAFGIEPTGWHNALADVEMTINVLKSVVEYLKQYKDVDIRPTMKKSRF
jgi:DNA polymerase III epsilon subunit-like protein